MPSPDTKRSLSPPVPPVALRVHAGRRPIVVELAGEIDAYTAPGLSRRLSRLPADDMIVDLAQVTFLGCAGLTVLLRLRARLHAGGRTLSLDGVSPLFRRVITLVDLQDVLPCRPAARAHGDHRAGIPIPALTSVRCRGTR